MAKTKNAEPVLDRAAPSPAPVYRGYIYIGPTIPGTKLTANSVFKGSLTQLNDFYAPELERLPQARRLFVPLDELALALVDRADPKGWVARASKAVLIAAGQEG